MESNSIVYIYDTCYKLYKTSEVHDNLLICYKQGYFQTSFKETPELNWAHIGVFKEGGLSEEQEIIHKNKIDGKVIRVNNLLITVPINVLRES